ncbi:MAG: hypothetical protein ABR524_12445 [Thermoanaerobaculia bacterium]
MNLNVLTLRHPLTLARLAWRKLRSRLQAGLSKPTRGDLSAAAAPSEPLIDVQELTRSAPR